MNGSRCGYREGVITAIVLVSVDIDRIPEVAQQLADLPGVREVYSVTGDCDLIVVVQVKEHDDFADVIADRLSKTPGIRATQTHIAFRQYSKRDEEAAFAIGLD